MPSDSNTRSPSANPLSDQSRWALQRERVLTMQEVMTTAGIDDTAVLFKSWHLATCPMDGHLCGTPCCQLADLD
jgi:hypothetical protein